MLRVGIQTLNLPKSFSLTPDSSCLLRANVIHYEMRITLTSALLHAPWLVRNEELGAVLNTLKNIHHESCDKGWLAFRNPTLRTETKFGKTYGEVIVITGSDDRRRRFPPDLNEGSGLQR